MNSAVQSGVRRLHQSALYFFAAHPGKSQFQIVSSKASIASRPLHSSPTTMFSVQPPPPVAAVASDASSVHKGEEKPWHAAFPIPKASLEDSTLSSITVSALRDKMKIQPDLNGRDFLVVDVRRTDFENAFIRGAVNLPAHSFYPTLDSLVPFLSSYKHVIFHCQSSSGRGPRTAAWYQDRLNELGITKEKSEGVVLTGGIKAWIKEFGVEDEQTVKL